jgi:hypothetical protein
LRGLADSGSKERDENKRGEKLTRTGDLANVADLILLDIIHE